MRRFAGVLVLSLLCVAVAHSDDPSSIIATIEAMNRFSDVYSAHVAITSISPKAPEGLTTEYTLYVRGLKSSLLICTAPKRNEGERILLRDGSFWMYFPRADRTIILHPTNTLTGSLSVGDMVSPPLLDLYEFDGSREEPDGGRLLSFVARSNRAPYGKVVYRYADGMIVSQDCFARSGLLLKKVAYEKFVPSDDGALFASRIRVINAVYPSYSSTIEMEDLRRVESFPDFYFTPQGMGVPRE